MSDTVPAAQFWSLDDARMTFLAPEDAPSQPEAGGGPHIAGGVHSTYASPSLIVHFATAAAELQVPDQAATPDPVPPTVSAYASQGADDMRPVVIIGALHVT